MRRATLVFLLLLSALGEAQDQIQIRMMAGPNQGLPPKEATDARSIARRAVFDEFHRQNPGIRVVNAGGLELTGDRGESGFLMSMAGDTAPDVFYVNFRQYYNYIDQGFCRPLDDLAERDPSALVRLNKDIEKVLRSYDGKLYAAPFYQVAMALYYRKDHFVEAGLNPDHPPQTWDEMIAYGRQIVESKPGRSGFLFATGLGGRAYHWSNFVYQAGGEVAVPGEGQTWKAALDSPEGEKALEMYRRLTAEKWTGKDGKTHGPIALLTANRWNEIREGKVSMWLDYTNDILLNITDLDPSTLGIGALPAGPAGHKNEINAGMWAINSAVKDPAKLAACWKFIAFFAGESAAKVSTDRFVEQGLGKLVNPVYLRRFGYADIAAQVDPLYAKANEQLFSTGHPEPYGRNMQQVYAVMDDALDRAKLEPNTPARAILADVSAEMNRKLLGYIPEAEMRSKRAWASGIVAGLGLALVGGLIWLARAMRRRTPDPVEPVPSQARRLLGVCLFPAVASLLLWSYYPLARGLIIAFQDYRIVQPAQWVGLDNFVAVFSQPVFWKSLGNTFLYVGLSLGIGFFLPVFLALALNEIPRLQTFFRTVFYLPAMTSPIVIAFLWRQFYDKSETGILNSVLAPGIDGWNWLSHFWGAQALPKANDWLGDPTLAMFAVVLPGIWAGAGPGSILYLAALRNIPTERYEAADLDGASWMSKIRHIVFPGMKNLILINLVGVFIASFKAMEPVFILTGGGPLNATRTIGLDVWENAFMFLKFGYATAVAWTMGVILIGFAALQIRSLTKTKFTTAKL